MENITIDELKQTIIAHGISVPPNADKNFLLNYIGECFMANRSLAEQNAFLQQQMALMYEDKQPTEEELEADNQVIVEEIEEMFPHWVHTSSPVET